MTMYKVVLFYKYTAIDPEVEVARQKRLCSELGLTGRVLVAEEGINGTVASPSTGSAMDEGLTGLDKYISSMSEDPRFADVDWKVSYSTVEPFPDFVVKKQKTIISTGNYIIPPPNPETFPGGKHLKPEEFHGELKKALTTHKDDYVVLDVRNNQEHMIGNFKGSINPKTRFFSEWPAYVEENIESFKGKKVLMYCTGGIRCEKASAFLKSKGCDDVSQLKGGIHRYLERYEKDGGGLWVGKNFVFDKRVTQPTTAESSKIVVGRCYECKEPFDEIDGGTVCTVCRDHVLVCSTCKTKCRNVYYCEKHKYLKNTYYYFLDHFTVEELKGQLQRLRAIHQQMLVGTEKDAPEKEIQDNAMGEGCTPPQARKRRKKCINKEKRKRGTKKFKNKRRTIMKQITKVEKRIEDLNSGACTVVKDGSMWCRTCMQDVKVCNGECWGFWSNKK